MNENEKYLFDLQGYIAVPDALDSAQLEKLNAVLDQHIEQECPDEEHAHHFEGLLSWGKTYRDLVDNPSIVSYIDVILSERFRLDHLYADLIRGGTSPIGATLGDKSIMDLRSLPITWPTLGWKTVGLAACRVRYKSNYRFPGEWRDMAENIEPCVRRVTGPAGMAVIFTEALTHGALPWTGQGEPRTVFLSMARIQYRGLRNTLMRRNSKA